MGHFLEYISSKSNEDLKFCEEREKGASKIAKDAAAKGGYAKLTAWHFEAKHPEYELCQKAIDQKKSASYFKDQMVKYLNEARGTSDQKRFQVAMGKAEVWGEVYHKLQGE